MASRSVNKVILVGNLGKDADTRYTTSGIARTTFPIATSRRWKDQQTGEWREETDWHNVLLWRQENLANYLSKGKQVYVEGRLQTRSYDDKDGNKRYMTEVVADDVILLGGRGEAPDQGYGQPVSMPRSTQPPPGEPLGGGQQTGSGGGQPSGSGGGQPSGSGGGQQAGSGSGPSPFDQGITDDDVPF